MRDTSSKELDDNFEAALLAEGLADHNGFYALLKVLTQMGILETGDIRFISESMNAAFELQPVRGNHFAQQLQKNMDDFLAGLLVKSSAQG